MKTLGKRLKEARLTHQPKKLTQKEVAELAGISQTTIADIERGRNDGSKYLAELAQAVNCSLTWLATSKGEMRGGEGFYRHENASTQEGETMSPLTEEQQRFLQLIGRMDKRTQTEFVALFEKLVPDRRKENIKHSPKRRMGEEAYGDAVDSSAFTYSEDEPKQSEKRKQK